MFAPKSASSWPTTNADTWWRGGGKSIKYFIAGCPFGRRHYGSAGSKSVGRHSYPPLSLECHILWSYKILVVWRRVGVLFAIGCSVLVCVGWNQTTLLSCTVWFQILRPRTVGLCVAEEPSDGLVCENNGECGLESEVRIIKNLNDTAWQTEKMPRLLPGIITWREGKC